MKVAYMSTVGTSDPTRASLPFHLAVNGSVEIGHEVTLLLAGDATELVKPSAVQATAGLGLPPMLELVAKVLARGVPVLV
jgi:predicted peroxiredoxin